MRAPLDSSSSASGGSGSAPTFHNPPAPPAPGSATAGVFIDKITRSSLESLAETCKQAGQNIPSDKLIHIRLSPAVAKAITAFGGLLGASKTSAHSQASRHSASSFGGSHIKDTLAGQVPTV